MNERIYNRKEMKERRQELRRAMTPAERILWQSLRGEQFGVKFRSQFSVGPFILDFYCPRLKLALELDGPSHEGAEEYDRVRQEDIEALGIVFLRFSNQEIYRNRIGVLELIAARVAERSGNGGSKD